MHRWFITSMMLGMLSNIWGMPVEGAPVTVQITLPADMEQTDRPLVLHIENLQLPPQASGIVRIFADLPQANADTSTEDEHFLGYFTILAKTSMEAAQGVQRHDATLDLSPKKQLLVGKKALTLTIVPLGGSTTSPAAPADATQGQPTFTRVYVATP